MLSLGKVCEQPLLSLTRICENGKWKMENYSSPKLGEVVEDRRGMSKEQKEQKEQERGLRIEN